MLLITPRAGWLAGSAVTLRDSRPNDTLINAGDSDLLSNSTRDPARPIQNHSKHTLIRFIYDQCLTLDGGPQYSVLYRWTSDFIGFLYLLLDKYYTIQVHPRKNA